MRTPRAVKALLLFDIDHTLLKGSYTHREAFNAGLKEVFGIAGNVEAVNPHGKTDWQIIIDVLAQNGVDEKTASKGIEACMAVMARVFTLLVNHERLVVIDGVHELLETVHSRSLGLGLVTGNIESIAWEKLSRAGIKEHFHFGGFGSDHRVRSKLVDIAMERAKKRYAGLSPSPVFLIGDTPRDIAAGREAGVCTVAVSTGVYTQDELQSHGPDYVVQSLSPVDGFEDILKQAGL
jgi:phosphoglycolate phosphatase-like HAD superfamily hydrolase